ncbi:MAG: TniB family NTP-binding protein [Janthinobacterium lividum]
MTKSNLEAIRAASGDFGAEVPRRHANHLRTSAGSMTGSPAVATDPATTDPEDGEPVLSPDIKAAFSKFTQSRMATRSAIAAAAMAKHNRIRLPYPRQIEAMGEFEEVRLLGLAMRGEQQLGLTIFERSGCGKSTAAAQYRLLRLAEATGGRQPVVHCRLSAGGGVRDMYVSILAELGDGFSNAGTERTLRMRAMDALEVAGVELLFLDEAQHGGKKSGFAGAMTSEVKILLDCGQVPIILLGTEEAIPIIQADVELSGRMISPCRLGPLDWFDDDDRDLWIGFLDALDARMVDDRVVAATAGLADEGLAEALWKVCEGVIGQLMRVTLVAVRQVARDGRGAIDRRDLADAVNQWSLGHGFTKINHVAKLIGS